jgi:hypothetical protein
MNIGDWLYVCTKLISQISLFHDLWTADLWCSLHSEANHEPLVNALDSGETVKVNILHRVETKHFVISSPANNVALLHRTVIRQNHFAQWTPNV